MSFLDTITDSVSKVAEKALSETGLSSLLMDNASTNILDSMQSFMGDNALQNLGFPDCGNLLQMADSNCCDPETYLMAFNSQQLGEFMNNLFGENINPMNDISGGEQGFDQTLRCAIILLSGNPEELLKKLGLGGGDGGGGGGLFGEVFSGIKGLLGGGGGGLGGILGGILGGGDGGGGGLFGGLLGNIPGMKELLPLALKVAPYFL